MISSSFHCSEKKKKFSFYLESAEFIEGTVLNKYEVKKHQIIEIHISLSVFTKKKCNKLKNIKSVLI